MSDHPELQQKLLAQDVVKVLALHEDVVEQLSALRDQLAGSAQLIEHGQAALAHNKTLSNNKRSHAALGDLLAGVAGLLEAAAGEMTYAADELENATRRKAAGGKRVKER
jgi:hypothetical protein